MQFITVISVYSGLQQAGSGHGAADLFEDRSFRSGKIGKIRISDVSALQVCHILRGDREGGGVHGETDGVQFELGFEGTRKVAGSIFFIDIADETDDRAASFEYSKPATMVFFIMERYQENGALPGT